MRYMLSASLAKVTVWERRKQAATEALGVGVVSLIFEEVGEWGRLTVYRRQR